jgi:uncharacterized protein YciI
MRPYAVAAIALSTALLPVPRAGAAPVAIAIASFDYTDSSGEPRDQTAAHAARLKMLQAEIADTLRRSGRFAPAALHCGKPPCSAEDLDGPDMQGAAKAQDARFVVFGGVHKMSTLIQWGQVEVMNTATGAPALSRTVTFRGDSDEAWHHAADYIGQLLLDGLKP